VTVSGVVGTWWFAPDLAATWWSPAIQDSWVRSVTCSLGSVCLGSLLVSILQVSHSMLVWLKRSSSPCGARNLSFVACIAEFLLSFLGRMVSYFNKYAFVYIGLYGYDFLESGHRAFELFQQRGWTTVIQDDLIGRVLHLASVVVGLCTAAVAIVLIVAHPGSTYDGGAWAGFFWSFILCLLVGTVVSRMILGVIMSACDTVLVCFAEAPRELEQNHPGIHRTLIQAWQQVYPEDRNAGYVL
jgi:Plasma-membrane choline transporter